MFLVFIPSFSGMFGVFFWIRGLHTHTVKTCVLTLRSHSIHSLKKQLLTSKLVGTPSSVTVHVSVMGCGSWQSNRHVHVWDDSNPGRNKSCDGRPSSTGQHTGLVAEMHSYSGSACRGAYHGAEVCNDTGEAARAGRSSTKLYATLLTLPSLTIWHLYLASSALDPLSDHDAVASRAGKRADGTTIQLPHVAEANSSDTVAAQDAWRLFDPLLLQDVLWQQPNGQLPWDVADEEWWQSMLV